MYGHSTPSGANSRPAARHVGLRPIWSRAIVLLVVAGAVLMLKLPGRPASAQGAPIYGGWLPSPALTAPTPIVETFAPVSGAEAEVRQALDRARGAFREARERSDPAVLAAVATGEWLEHERNYIAEMQAQGLRERWSLRHVATTGAAITATEATVCADERWDRVDIGPGGAAPPLALRYTLRYTLQRVGAAWRVGSVSYADGSCTV